MRKRDLERFQKRLLAKKKELQENIARLRKESLATIRESTGELSSHTYHMADLGTDAMEREKKFQLAHKSNRFLYHIDEALRRIEEGNFGKCHVCGGNISIQRLNIVPHARLCIACKEKEEGKRTQRR